MGFVDWNTLWNNEMLVTRRVRLNSGPFWDEVATREGGAAGFPEELTELQLARIAVQPKETVLEIGPGLGRLTIPLARAAAALTAVDPSAQMLERLRSLADAEGIATLHTVHCSWEKAEEVTQLTPHTVIMASYSLFMQDMRSQLQRMLRLATDRIVLFVPGDPRLPEAVERMIYGAKVSSQMADHVLLFNLLYEMGVDADVEVFTFPGEKRYRSREEALEQQMHYYDLPTEKQPAMAAYLEEQFREEAGEWILPRMRKTAMLRWRVQ